MQRKDKLVCQAEITDTECAKKLVTTFRVGWRAKLFIWLKVLKTVLELPVLIKKERDSINFITG